MRYMIDVVTSETAPQTTAVGCTSARLQLAWSQSPALTLLSVLLTPPLPPLPPFTSPLSHASQRRLPFQGMSYRLFLFSSPLSIFLLFLCFPSLSSVSFHPGRPPKYSSVPELGSLTPTSPSSPVHPLPLPSPSSGDVSNDGGDGQLRGLESPSHTAPMAQQLCQSFTPQDLHKHVHQFVVFM